MHKDLQRVTDFAGTAASAQLQAAAPPLLLAMAQELQSFRDALGELVWGCENGGLRPAPAWSQARGLLGEHDPIRRLDTWENQEREPTAFDALVQALDDQWTPLNTASSPIETPDLAAQLVVAQVTIAAQQNMLSAWSTAAERWRTEGGKFRRDQVFELIEESRLKHAATIVERVLQERNAALELAKLNDEAAKRAETELAEVRLAAGDRLDPMLLAALRAGRLLHEALDDADWLLGTVGGKQGRIWARERLQDGLHAAETEDDEVQGAERRRAALEAISHAASELRAAIADHDLDAGVTWMYGPGTVSERIDMLDTALDALARVDAQPAAAHIEAAYDLVVRQIAAAVAAGEMDRAKIALTTLVGTPLGTLITQLLRRGARQAHPPEPSS